MAGGGIHLGGFRPVSLPSCDTRRARDLRRRRRGLRDEATRDALIADKSAKIEAKLAKLMPWLDTKPEFAWAGAFGSTSTGLPIIGALPRRPRVVTVMGYGGNGITRPRVVTVMGYGGNGITYSRIAAEYVSSRMAGREDSDADLFAFDR